MATKIQTLVKNQDDIIPRTVAEAVYYDNKNSQLESTNIQDVIDELKNQTDKKTSLILGEDNETAFAGDKGKIAYDHAQKINGNPHNVTAQDVQALPLNGGTVNGSITINGTLTINGSQITVSDGSINIKASNSINFETPLLTQNGESIQSSSDIISPMYFYRSFSKDSSSPSIGPFPKKPTSILVMMGISNAYFPESGNSKATVGIGRLQILNGPDGEYVKGYYTLAPYGGANASLYGWGEIGTISGNEGNYMINLNKNAGISEMFFRDNINDFAFYVFFN